MKDGQTIGQWLNWDFKTNHLLEIKDRNGALLYYERSSGYWVKREYDSEGNQIYFEDSGGFWAKCEYDSESNRIYHENSNGEIEDNRIPEVIEHNGRKYQLIP
jgi:hypothetical protein